MDPLLSDLLPPDLLPIDVPIDVPPVEIPPSDDLLGGDAFGLIIEAFGFPVVYTPGSDVAAGANLEEFIWGRLGNDILLAYQPLGNDVGSDQLDLLVGDIDFPQLVEQLPEIRDWSDTFVLGDWRTPYYVGGDPFSFGTNSFALIADFDPRFDTVQLYGQPSNYQITDLGLASLIWFNTPVDLGITTIVVPDLVAVIPVSGLDLFSEYFRFVGDRPAEPLTGLITQIGTPGNDISDSIAVDLFGNVWVTGSSTSSLTHDSNVGSRDVWLKKYDQNGTQLFANQLGSPSQETSYGIITDSEGNVIVLGLSFGEFAGVYDDLSTPYDGFNGQVWISKFDNNGTLLWLRNVNGNGNGVPSSAFGIDIDKDDNIYVSGVVNVPTPPGSLLPLQTDNFFSKFSPDGDVLLYSQYGNDGVLDFEDSYNMALDQFGNSYRVGFVTSAWAGEPAKAYDGYLAKNNASGELEWVAQIITDDVDWVWGVDTDSVGNIVISGWTFGSLPGTSGNLGSLDAFVAKYNSSGEQLWSRHIGTSQDDVAFTLKIDDTDHIYIAGYTDGVLAGESNQGSYDFWVGKYDSFGDNIWIRQYGTVENDQAYDLVIGVDGYLYLTGITDGSLGGLNNGSYDAWIAKIDASNGDLADFSGAQNDDYSDIITGNLTSTVPVDLGLGPINGSNVGPSGSDSQSVDPLTAIGALAPVVPPNPPTIFDSLSDSASMGTGPVNPFILEPASIGSSSNGIFDEQGAPGTDYLMSLVGVGIPS